MPTGKINLADNPERYCKYHPDRPVFVRRGNPIPLILCRECYQEALAKGRGKGRGRRAEAEAEHPEHLIVLDFTGREELLGRIAELAGDEERTPAGQVMYWIRRHLRSSD